MPLPKILIAAADSFSAKRIADVAAGNEPSIDILEAANHMEADLLTFDSLRVGGGEGGYDYLRLQRPFLPPAPQPVKRTSSLLFKMARAIFERQEEYDIILLTGEDLAIPLAWYCRGGKKRARIVTIGHYLNPMKKQIPLRRGLLGSLIDKLIVYSPVQHLFATERLGLEEGRLELIPFHADHAFYHPPAEQNRDPQLVVAAGKERRDYATLFAAAEGQPIRMELGAGSPWSRFRRTLPPLPNNANNHFRSRMELRELYHRAGAVVVPLVETEFQAGISVALEAMSAGTPVIISRTTGLQHLITDGVNGLYVKPGAPNELRAALKRLRTETGLAERLGAAARQTIEQSMTTRHFVTRLDRVCQSSLRKKPRAEFYEMSGR